MTALAALLMIAAAFWAPSIPACGQPSIERVSVFGLVPFDTPLMQVGEADTGDCTIKIADHGLYGSGRSCMVVVHEYGHLLGFQHSTNPDNVMYPVLGKVVWPCRWPRE